MTKKIQPSEAIRKLQALYAHKLGVRAYYKHEIKRVFVECSDMGCLKVAWHFCDAKDWDPGEIRIVNGYYPYFSFEVSQDPKGEDA